MNKRHSHFNITAENLVDQDIVISHEGLFGFIGRLLTKRNSDYDEKEIQRNSKRDINAFRAEVKKTQDRFNSVNRKTSFRSEPFSLPIEKIGRHFADDRGELSGDIVGNIIDEIRLIQKHADEALEALKNSVAVALISGGSIDFSSDEAFDKSFDLVIKAVRRYAPSVALKNHPGVFLGGYKVEGSEEFHSSSRLNDRDWYETPKSDVLKVVFNAPKLNDSKATANINPEKLEELSKVVRVGLEQLAKSSYEYHGDLGQKVMAVDDLQSTMFFSGQAEAVDIFENYGLNKRKEWSGHHGQHFCIIPFYIEEYREGLLRLLNIKLYYAVGLLERAVHFKGTR